MSTLELKKGPKFPEQAAEITRILEQAGLSYEEAAERVIVAQDTMRKIARGYQPASDHVMGLLRDLLKRARSARDLPINPVLRARQAAGLSIKELAKRTRYQIGVLQAVEEGRSPISEKMADALAKALPDLDREALLVNDEHPPTIGVGVAAYGTKPEINLGPGINTARYVPLISWARAGESGGNFEDIYDYEGQIAFDSRDPKATAIRIMGDSMWPQVPEGAVVIVSPSEGVRNSDWIIGKTRDGSQFFKILTVVSPGLYRFSSLNPAYPPFDRKEEEIEWLYPVVDVNMKPPARR